MKPYDFGPFERALQIDPDTGSITWPGGRKAGYLTPKGYWHVTIGRVEVPAHRLIWAVANRTWPDLLIDHINGDKTDNRIANLRQCTAAENAQNTSACRRKDGRMKGVQKRGGKFHARIGVASRQKYIGSFNTEHEAHDAYCAAKRSMHTFQPEPRR